MNFEPNQLIDNRYKIIKKLDEGGMGAVWKATDSRTNDSVVVLKFPLKYNDPEILERFAQEAGTMRELAGDCDNILDIQDIGSVKVNDIDNVPYYVMRFQTGGALRDWQAPKDDQGNPIFTRESLSWVTGVATALDFLHHQPEAVFHRDVKPENILFNASGAPKLSDFGIVKNIKKATTNITQTGAAMGTVAYMPPEIWRGGKFSPASDQFSFAATVYEMISGKRPYDGETPFAMLEALHKGHEKLEETIGLSAAASRALDKGLSHEPADRFDSCKAFSKSFLLGLASAKEPKPQMKPSEMATGVHAGAVGGEVVGGKPIDVAPPVVVSPDSGGKLFSDTPINPKPPEKPKPVANSGSPRPAWFGSVALLVVGLVGGGLYLGGAFSGSIKPDQPRAVRPVPHASRSNQKKIEERAQEIADQKLKEEANQREKTRIAEEQAQAELLAKKAEAKRIAESRKREMARLAVEAEKARDEARRKKEKEDARKKEIAKKSISFSVNEIDHTELKKRSDFIGQTIAIVVKSDTDFAPIEAKSEIESIEFDIVRMDSESDETQTTYFGTLLPKSNIPLGQQRGKILLKFSNGELAITKKIPMKFNFASPD